VIGRLCNVYKSAKTANLYLYVARDVGLVRVPEALLEKFGEPELALTIDLHPTRTLAREDPIKVIAAIEENGFYLQLPPQTFTPKTL
jgi:uncharacterized protein YcgL (UPF0745 family)